MTIGRRNEVDSIKSRDEKAQRSSRRHLGTGCSRETYSKDISLQCVGKHTLAYQARGLAVEAVHFFQDKRGVESSTDRWDFSPSFLGRLEEHIATASGPAYCLSPCSFDFYTASGPNYRRVCTNTLSQVTPRANTHPCLAAQYTCLSVKTYHCSRPDDEKA